MEFVQFSYNLLSRPELEQVFLTYAKKNNLPKARMTAENLCDFMANEQKNEICIEEAQHYIEAFEPSGNILKSHKDTRRFFMYPNPNDHEKIDQFLSFPLIAILLTF